MAYNSVNAPYLGSFKEAVERHNKTVPIRGHKEGVRPLGNRRYHGAASIAMPDPDTVQLIWYRQPLVVWHSDNSMTFYKPRGCNAYAPEQIAGFLPRGIHLVWRKGCAFVARESVIAELKEGKPLRFVRDASSVLVMDNPPLNYAYRVRRGAVAPKLREQLCGEFLNWVQLTVPIGGLPSPDERQKAQQALLDNFGFTLEFQAAQQKRVGRMSWDGERERTVSSLGYMRFLPHGNGSYGKKIFHRPTAELLVEWMRVGNEERWTTALSTVLFHTGVWQRGHNFNPDPVIKDVNAYIGRLVAYLYRDEVFNKVEVPQNTVPTNRNSEYFNDIVFNFGQTDSMSECSST